MTENSDIGLDDISTTGDPMHSEKVAFGLTKKKTGNPDIQPELRLTIYNYIKFLTQNGHWNCHRNKEIQQRFNIGKTSVGKLVRLVQVDIECGVHEIPNLMSKRVGKSGRKCKWTTPQIVAKLEAAPVELRSCSRDSAVLVGCSHTTILNKTRGKDSILCRATLQVQPALTNLHKINRVKFIRQKII